MQLLAASSLEPTLPRKTRQWLICHPFRSAPIALLKSGSAIKRCVMDGDRTTFLAMAIVIVTGALWGLYWLPVRQLAEIALPGAWGTLAIVAAATVLLLPFAVKGRRPLADASPLALASIALGGVAFALYSVAFVYGRVAIIIFCSS
jgi:hypothetical protein